MKLRTELCEQSPLMCDFDALKHDAMAAHALLQAMEEYDLEGWSDQANPVAWARERAAEILAGWLGKES